MRNWVVLILMCVILKGPITCFQSHVNKALKGEGEREVPEMGVKYGIRERPGRA